MPFLSVQFVYRNNYNKVMARDGKYWGVKSGVCQAVLAVTLLFSLSGCIFGNGDPYDQNRHTPNTDQFNEGDPPPPLFYEWDDNEYFCTPAEGGDPIPGYRGRIEVSGVKFYHLGDKCHPRRDELNYEDITFSPKRDYLAYEENIYHLLPPNNPLTFIPAVTWCQAENESVIINAFIKDYEVSELTAIVQVTEQSSLFLYDDLIFSVDLSDAQNDIDYDGENFHLSVEEEKPLDSYQYEGVLEYSESNGFHRYSVLCWLP